MGSGVIGNSLKILRVVAAFIEEGGRVLVQQRPTHKARASLWEFPGGKVDPGESDAKALVREIDEELGISVAVHDLYGETMHSYGDLTIHLLVYHAERISKAQPLVPTDAQQVAWHDAAQLHRLDLCEADRVIVARHRVAFL